MSDLNQIFKDKTEQKQDDLSLINDNLKTISISDINDSEYEDVEEDEIIDTPIINKGSLKSASDDDELLINLKPRRARKKIEDDEHSEDDDDNQNVPKTKINEILDDDNNTQSPAYIPRKGKFYEHDDRTLDENQRSKQEISRNENRAYKDSDGKWQHDLYFRDEQFSKSRRSIPKQNENRSKSVEIHSKPRYNQHHHRELLHLNDYMVRPPTADPRRRLPQESERNPRTNNFDFKDPFSYNRNTQAISRQQRGEHNPYQVDERTFHRRKNFTNSQFQQHDNVSKPFNRIDQRQSKDNYQFQGNNDYRQYEFLPPRLRINNRNSTQKQEYQEKSMTNIDRPKRYSNMRNNLMNSIQPQTSSSSYQFEQNDWPQAPPPPTSYPPQQPTSRYISINYSQGSIFDQV